jgi:hypothetical protein
VTAAESAVEPPKLTAADLRRAEKERAAAAKLAVAVAAPERGGLHPDPLRTTFPQPSLGDCLDCDRRKIAAWLLGGRFDATKCTHQNRETK